MLTIEPALSEGRWQLLKSDGTSILKQEPTMPLTITQKRWLASISQDPRIHLFQDEILKFEDVKPLFTPKDYYIFDQYQDGDDYQDENYIRNFRKILDAIKNQHPLRIETYNHKGKKIFLSILPKYLEYSEKDDKFRLIGFGDKLGGTVNLGRIISCEEDKEIDKTQLKYKIPPRKRRVILELIDERKSLERALLHFAHFQKETERINEKKYKITVDYDKDDETELVIRVLSFGPMIKVVKPQHFINLIKDRLVKQKSWGL